MALKPTIYKVTLTLADLNRSYYDTFNLTLAQHPSETIERMMVRLLAYGYHAAEGLRLTSGLGHNEEPDLVRYGLDGQLLEWIEVGEPSLERLKKASRMAPAVAIYCFNAKATTWWKQIQSKLPPRLPFTLYHWSWESVQALAPFAERTMALTLTLTEESAYLDSERGQCVLQRSVWYAGGSE